MSTEESGALRDASSDRVNVFRMPEGLDPRAVLEVLDECARVFTFPMLDNGYTYLAATRLSLFSDTTDWAIVIEVFGYSPRAHLPTIEVCTFASRLHNREAARAYYPNSADFAHYLRMNPNNETVFVYPLDDGPWIDNEHVAADATTVALRGMELSLESHRAVPIHALCRDLAASRRDELLATGVERRANVPPPLEEVLVLDAWHHPDLVTGELPSDTETFRQLALVAVTADASRFDADEPANTHWTNWPSGGSL